MIQGSLQMQYLYVLSPLEGAELWGSPPTLLVDLGFVRSIADNQAACTIGVSSLLLMLFENL